MPTIIAAFTNIESPGSARDDGPQRGLLAILDLHVCSRERIHSAAILLFSFLFIERQSV